MKALILGLVLLFSVNPARAAELDSCLAIRGNGELVTAHFSAISRLLETEPLFDGGVGGSSGSISLFLYESILQNPALKECEKLADNASVKTCKAHRVSLLLKSLFAYVDVVVADDDFQALIGAVKTVEKTLAAVGITKDTKVDKLRPTDLLRLGPQLAVVLTSSEIKGLINREFIELLLLRHGFNGVREAIIGLQSFGGFDATDKRVLFRSGLLNFQTIARRFGRIGNFYAGRGTLPLKNGSTRNLYEADRVNAFVDRCTPLALGKTWTELKSQDPSCDKEITEIIKDYRDRLVSVDKGQFEDEKKSPPSERALFTKCLPFVVSKASMATHIFPFMLDKNAKAACDDAVSSFIDGIMAIVERNKGHLVEDEITDSRIKDEVGKFSHILVSAAFLPEGPAQIFKAQRALYDAGKSEFAPKTPLGIFDQMVYGFWGQPADSDLVAPFAREFSNDLKASKARGLGAVDWFTALSRSAAEPGLSRVLEGPSPNQATAAGWSDLSPVLVTRSMGCKKVTYITRMGSDSPFGIQVARLFGMTSARPDSPEFSKTQEFQIYDLTNPNSSFSRALTNADMVLCTNWDHYSGFTEVRKIEKDAFSLANLAPAAKQQFMGCGGKEDKANAPVVP